MPYPTNHGNVKKTVRNLDSYLHWSFKSGKGRCSERFSRQLVMMAEISRVELSKIMEEVEWICIYGYMGCEWSCDLPIQGVPPGLSYIAGTDYGGWTRFACRSVLVCDYGSIHCMYSMYPCSLVPRLGTRLSLVLHKHTYTISWWLPGCR